MIQWMDNFSNYGTDETKMTDGLYASAGGTLSADPDGVSSGKCFLPSQYNHNALRRVFSSALSTVGVGFRCWFPNLPGNSGTEPAILRFNDSTNEIQIHVTVKTTGALSVYRSNGSSSINHTLLGTTSTPSITAGAWHHIEVKVVFSQTVGTVTIKVNGTSVLALTGLDNVATSEVSASQVCFTNGGSSLTSDWYIKDFFIWDTTGSQNNDFIGDIDVVTLTEAADDTFNWAASTGSTGCNLINESTPDDAGYISANATPPAASTFTLTDLDPDYTTVKGLMTFARMKKTDGGDATVQVSLNSGGSLDDGADRAVTTAYTYWTDLSELDPATGTAWTPTTVNAAKIKINRTT